MFYLDEKIYIADNNIAFDLQNYKIYCIEDTNMEEVKRNIIRNRDTIENKEIECIKIHVSNICNLKCNYCYASYGNYGKKDTLMSFKIAERIVDYIKRTKKIRYVTFFGGEPFMAMDVIEYICENLIQNNIKFFAQTNGTLLNDRILEVIKKYHIKLTISLDGMKEINDYNRKFRSGQGTYDLIVSNINKINQSIPNAIQAIQSTLSKEFIKYNELEIIDFIHKITKACIIKLEYDINLNLDLSKEMIKRKIRVFFDTLINKKFIIDGYPYHCLRTFFERKYNRYRCSAGNNISITSDGKVYPCQFYFNNKDYCMGDMVKENTIQTQKIQNMEKKNNVSCKNCIANSYCEFCIAKKEDCNYNKLFVECFFDIFAQYIVNGKFSVIYNNYKDIILRL